MNLFDGSPGKAPQAASRGLDLAVLARSELMKDAARTTLEAGLEAGRRRVFSAGTCLFEQDAEPREIYVVLAGRLRITHTTADGRQIIIRYVGAGETAGFAVLTGAASHPNAASAIDQTHAMGWSADAFRRLMRDHPCIAVNAVGVIGARLHEMQVRLQELASETVERRLARTVLRLAEQAGRRTPAGVEIAFPLTRQDLAEMAGTTLHTVSRTMSGWEELGLVDSARRRVILRDPAALARAAAGAA